MDLFEWLTSFLMYGNKNRGAYGSLETRSRRRRGIAVRVGVEGMNGNLFFLSLYVGYRNFSDWSPRFVLDTPPTNDVKGSDC